MNYTLDFCILYYVEALFQERGGKKVAGTMTIYLWIFKHVFPKNKNILLHN